MNKHQGFTLIELMVSMAIAMVALLAVSQIYLNSRQTFKLQAMQNRVSEDGRFAISMLQRIINQAGFRPNSNTPMPRNRIVGTSDDAITVRFTSDGRNQMDCTGNVAAAGDIALDILQKGNNLKCGNIDWIAPSSSGTGNATELVDLQFKYGIDTNDNDAGGNPSTLAEFGCGANLGNMKARDCVANSYVNQLDEANSDQLVTVKICLVLRSEQTDRSQNKATAIKDCNNVDIVSSVTDQKLYRMFRTTIQLRNR